MAQNSSFPSFQAAKSLFQEGTARNLNLRLTLISIPLKPVGGGNPMLNPATTLPAPYPIKYL
jgi:hypothetical protein